MQSILQTLFIFEGLRKRCVTVLELKQKKGRNQITFLIMLNISLWLLYTLTRTKYSSILFKGNSGLKKLNASSMLVLPDMNDPQSILINKLYSQRIMYELISSENARALKWIIINTISYPLLLYYHFHTSYCLSSIWSRCYSNRENKYITMIKSDL